jgi:catechol 2,3-dioxygenase-like lactoylglutathione lyase family enzyme
MRPHISLNVKDVSQSIEFYQKMFGTKPQKQTNTYAKFDLKNPALNFSMQTNTDISKVNHFGIEVDSADSVKVWEQLFIARGLLTLPEDNVECCFALQDKVWVKDPDGNTWEIFFVHQQLIPENKKSGDTTPGSAQIFGKKCC